MALGGGAARGIAHIGALKALHENHFKPHCISGTSAGALVASYSAFGWEAESILEICSALNLSKLANFTLESGGLFSTNAIRRMLLRDLGDCRIEDAKIPLAICATDIETGEQLIFREGNLADAVCASMAVPGLFVPVKIAGRIVVDGGLIENVPISPLKEMGAGITVGIDLSYVTRYPKPQNTLDVVSNAINISIDHNTRRQLKKADISVTLDLSDYSFTDNSGRVEELFHEGYSGMKDRIGRLIWYKRMHAFIRITKVSSLILPFKVPEGLKKLTRSPDKRRRIRGDV